MYKCKCPYCGKSIDDPDDCYENEMTYDYQCPHCEKYFVFTVGYIRFYTEKKAPCLNGAKHEYEPTCTYPKEYIQMRCKHCDELA
mgnify:CR=1 FL=1